MSQESTNIWTGDILSLQSQLEKLHRSHVLSEYKYRSSSILDILLERQGHVEEIDDIVSSIVQQVSGNIESVASGQVSYSVFTMDIAQAFPKCTFLARPTTFKFRVYKSAPKGLVSGGQCDLNNFDLNDEEKGTGAVITATVFLDQARENPTSDLASTLAHELTHLYEWVLISRKGWRTEDSIYRVAMTNDSAGKMLRSRNAMARAVASIVYFLLGPERKAFIASIPHELAGIVNEENAPEKIGTAEAATKTIESLPSYSSLRYMKQFLEKIARASGEEIADVEVAFHFIYRKSWTYDRLIKWLTLQVNEASERFWRTAAKVTTELRDKYIDSGRKVRARNLQEFLLRNSAI